MTKTAIKAVNQQIRALRRERREWLTGTGLPWGTPWCAGPGSLGHTAAADGSPYCCDGCATRAYSHTRAAEVGERIRRLQESLAPVVQGGLW